MEKKLISVMPCLDMRAGRVVKGVHFVDIADAGDPVACAQAYCAAGADELALLDITATVEARDTLTEVVRKVADVRAAVDDDGFQLPQAGQQRQFLGGNGTDLNLLRVLGIGFSV